MLKKSIAGGIILLFLLSSSISYASNHPNVPPIADAGEPYFGSVGDYFMLNGSGSYDPDGEIVEYLWRIAEEESPTFVSNIYNKTFGHHWNASGMWLAYLFVTDNEGLTDRDYTFVAIDKPLKPDNPSGKISIKPGLKYEYTTKSIDPDGEQLYYRWYWGDGNFSEWLGPFESGENISASHRWNKQGNYYISVQAKDTEEHYSMYSDSIEIKVALLKSSYNKILDFLPYMIKMKLYNTYFLGGNSV